MKVKEKSATGTQVALKATKKAKEMQFVGCSKEEIFSYILNRDKIKQLQDQQKELSTKIKDALIAKSCPSVEGYFVGIQEVFKSIFDAKANLQKVLGEKEVALLEKKRTFAKEEGTYKSLLDASLGSKKADKYFQDCGSWRMALVQLLGEREVEKLQSEAGKRLELHLDIHEMKAE